MKLRSWSFAVALALTALLLPAHGASAAPANKAADHPACADGHVCFWSRAGFRGTTWSWPAGSGYRDMPPRLHDHVGSFVSNIDGGAACFVNWEPFEKRDVMKGHWRSDYLDDFGGRIDGVDSYVDGVCP
ncbi:peptidase inhibitor family I36 protein [Streptomyces coeruleorubidus]|uniref:peptidase inhibitor family I36 protein n=1 Tax=Streptomyces coeruleorubidus TaxID=116188 RepID=UPI00364CC539